MTAPIQHREKIASLIQIDNGLDERSQWTTRQQSQLHNAHKVLQVRCNDCRDFSLPKLLNAPPCARGHPTKYPKRGMGGERVPSCNVFLCMVPLQTPTMTINSYHRSAFSTQHQDYKTTIIEHRTFLPDLLNSY